MIQTQHFKIGTREFTKTYSDINHTIKQTETGIEYNSAIDLATNPKEYTETENEIQYVMPTFDD